MHVELPSVLWMVDPEALHLQALTDVDPQQVPDDSHFRVAAGGTQPGDGISIFVVLKNDTFKSTLKFL
jgi:hypothetical protein